MKCWIKDWFFLQMDYRSNPVNLIEDIQVVKIRLSNKAESIKLNFSNLYGTEPLVFEKVVIEHSQKLEKIVTYNQQRQIIIQPGEEITSDAIEIDIAKDEWITCTTILGQKVKVSSGIVTYSTKYQIVKNYIIIDDEYERKKQEDIYPVVAENPKRRYIYGISGVEILTSNKISSVAFFGDSLIQQGHFTDSVKERLGPTKSIGVLNYGIGGSRVLDGTDKKQDNYFLHGESGVTRFFNLLSNCELDKIVVLHGINDFIHGVIHEENQLINASSVISGLIKYAELAKIYDKDIYICTLLPMSQSSLFGELLEERRCEVNNWILSNTLYDGVFDTAKIVSDCNDSTKLKDIYDSGDGLHLSIRGGESMSKAIDLSVL